MKITGVIAEYNPFHYGHAHQLREARKQGATHIVAVMGGDFLQRGAPALADKRVRARAALSCGADLVLELPLPYACATAERFAFGGVAVLQGLGCVDALSFGSESGDLEALARTAALLDDPRLPLALAPLLDQGMTFAAARQRAVEELGGREAAALLGRPNDILAVEYLRQLERLGCSIRPETVLRQGAGHDAQTLAPLEWEGRPVRVASAAALRRQAEAGDWQGMALSMPRESWELFREAARQGKQANPARLELPLLARLRAMSLEEIRRLPDLSEGLEHRILAAVKAGTSLEGVLAGVKTKRYPRARLQRILLSAWLGLEEGMNGEPPPYLRVLGMNPRGEEILSRAKRRARLPVSASLARLEETGPRAARFARLEARSVDLYQLLTPSVGPCGTDYTAGLVKVGDGSERP